ncbi:CLUMA_CG003902, isoform A [Clunio marinus]|uniref:CLUMA_CG003902, isoform A n=1 Tax=Clunio marinus TaxID=568069 RepID=A0A1J1HS24_9DIPT|nr:CLUMA_CG003902, isoform A [Clunio marinus]
MEEFLYNFHHDEIINILKAADKNELPRSLQIDLSVLESNDSELFKKIKFRFDIWNEKPKWIDSLNIVQTKVMKENAGNSMVRYFSVKENFPVEFINLPNPLKNNPKIHNLWNLLQIKGSVVRSGEVLMKEFIREFKCRSCKQTMKFEADRIQNYYFDIPERCIHKNCKGTIFNTEERNSDEPNLDFIVKYQEVSIQLPSEPQHPTESLLVELEDELVESCAVGDRVTITGTFETRSKHNINSHRLVIRAAGVVVHEDQQKMLLNPTEMTFLVKSEWKQDLDNFDDDEIKLRDLMVDSVAPELEGLAIIKLGLLLVLCSGGKTNGNNSVKNTRREIAHFLMIGDPSCGKSQILKAASKISINSVRAVGYATTTAGLTATVHREGGCSFIEPGALVRANNGICCIDEINLMSKDHRGSIHEVMESQKITINKAGLRQELQAKCSIIAAMNQKNVNKDLDAKNISLEQSLLSRFDLIFELQYLDDLELHERIADLILSGSAETREDLWNDDRLQKHILVAKNISVEFTSSVYEILKRYYLFCKNDEDIEVSRTTPRMLNSLEQLTICHAKLMLRSKTQIIDAVTVIIIMESSWSFGRFLRLPNVMLSKTPIGPTNSCIAEVLEKLHLEHLLDEQVESLTQPKTKHAEKPQEAFDISELDEIFAAESEDEKDMFSTQAINKLRQPEFFPKTTNNFTGSLVSTTSMIETEQNSQNFTKRKTDFENNSEDNKKKKLNVEDSSSVETDSLLANLNSLASLFGKGVGEDSSEKKNNLDQENKTNEGGVKSKLQRFNYDAKCDENNEKESEEIKLQESQETAVDSITSDTDPSREKENYELEKERRFLEDMKDFDIWDD